MVTFVVYHNPVCFVIYLRGLFQDNSCKFSWLKLLSQHHICLQQSLVSAEKAGTRLLTHILTQTAKILCGNSGENDAKQYLEPNRTKQNSAQKYQTDTRAVAHNPEVAGSSPVSATIKTTDFERNRWFFFTF